MSKNTRESSIIKAYSQGYMFAIYNKCPNDSNEQWLLKQPHLQERWKKGHAKGMEVRKLHRERLKNKPWFVLQ